MTKKTNPRAEIISLMRGFFVCPIISFLHKHKLTDKIIRDEFSKNSFKVIKNKTFFESILNYLVCLGLLRIKRKKNIKNIFYLSTELGKKIFLRSGSFLLLHSYKPFVNKLEKNLTLKKKLSVSCDRGENVIGSGSINNKKFFPRAVDLLKKENIGLIADVGCGDGNFISQVSEAFPSAEIFASDISNIAVKATKKRLSLKSPSQKKNYLVCDAVNVKKWALKIKKIKVKKNSKILISMWYILHEISKNNKFNIIKFFKTIYKFLPEAIVLIGEITRIDNHILAFNKNTSIMPEFLFFHELSGQGILRMSDYDFILKKIPYKLIKKIEFDIVKYKNLNLPSAFIWLLKN
jgi:ubiquinone/menaquinone biosynthesis C-methylase UbiE|tara:strand:- start:68 stop:1114 length:1047 start_codon:yes stop_codon:yes gene_type:complete